MRPTFRSSDGRHGSGRSMNPGGRISARGRGGGLKTACSTDPGARVSGHQSHQPTKETTQARLTDSWLGNGMCRFVESGQGCSFLSRPLAEPLKRFKIEYTRTNELAQWGPGCHLDTRTIPPVERKSPNTASFRSKKIRRLRDDKNRRKERKNGENETVPASAALACSEGWEGIRHPVEIDVYGVTRNLPKLLVGLHSV